MFDRAEFNRFCSNLKIDSKEFGTVPLRLLGTQIYAIDEIEKGLKEDIHDFYFLKARQLGISTVFWALDLYWLFKHPGLRGTLVTHDDETREECRANISAYMDSLPIPLKIPHRVHNRNMLDLKNRSRLSYQVAGTKKNTKLGRGKGINFCHGTEISSYGDEDAFASLLDSLAETFEHRLFLWESTALGFNLWYDLYEEARKSVTQRAVFIGWWRNELYKVSKDSDIFKVYGDEDPSPSEYEWIDGVKRIYNFEIQPEQLAWARWKLFEKHRGNEQTFFQEFPPLEPYAWQMSGSKFFSNKTLTDTKMMMEKQPHSKDHYRYSIGATFDLTTFYLTAPFQCHLTVWEEPDPLGIYVISADPAFGANENSDRSCIQVLKCYADGAEQVAEFCTTELATYAFAWVIAHLAGGYRSWSVGSDSLAESMVILEINGPGRNVWDELQRIQQTGGYTTSDKVNTGLMDVVGNIRNFLYHRTDSLSGNFAYHMKTTHELKDIYMNKFRDAFEQGILTIRSDELLDEMKSIVRKETSIEAGSSRQKDDRAIAMGLAVHAWKDALLPDLYERNWTKAAHFQHSLSLKQNGSVFQAKLSDWLQRFQPLQ
jgi:hypothetical protein